MSKKLLIHQYLSKTGRFETKQDAIDALHAGRIKINGEVITNKQFQINPNNCEVKYNGEILSDIQDLYIVMNKPAGYICSRFNKPQDEGTKKQKSAFELLKFLNLSPRIEQTLFTIGRLDDDTSGLLLFTNDTKFRDKILKSPDKVKKRYLVRILKPLTDQQHRELKAGVYISTSDNKSTSESKDTKNKFMSRPSKVEIDVEDRCNIYITIDEQKKDQIRQTIAEIGNEVIELKLISIGGLTLKSLRLPSGICDKVDQRIIHEILDIEPARKIVIRD